MELTYQTSLEDAQEDVVEEDLPNICLVSPLHNSYVVQRAILGGT